MKVPFSYQNHFFKPTLITSFLGHLVFLGAGNFLFSMPEFAVQRAPQSIEVVILEETKVRKEKAHEASVLVSDESPERIIYKKEKDFPKPEPFQKPFMNHPEKGAMTEAKPDYLKNPPPVYPNLARKQGWEGTVILKVLVSGDGSPIEVLVEQSSGYKILDQAALKAVRKWKFLPARVGTFTFSSRVRVPIRFLLVEERKNNG